jgi:hypothetical protein
MMEIFESLLKNNVLTKLAIGIGVSIGIGASIGIGVSVLGPVLIPAVARIGRPAAKAAIIAGLTAYERSREVMAELGEGMEDLYAEARAEMGQQSRRQAEPETSPQS